VGNQLALSLTFLARHSKKIEEQIQVHPGLLEDAREC
jgi:hypothetical protein